MRLRHALIGIVALAGFATAAWAIQPGTTGTEKRFQEQGLRSGVLIQKNNTATATVAGSSGTATLNAAGSGVITTGSVATTADSDWSLTLTNNMIAAADIVLASVNLGTSVGKPYISEVTPGAGSVVIKVRNASGASTMNGTIQIRFLVVKQSANGSD